MMPCSRLALLQETCASVAGETVEGTAIRNMPHSPKQLRHVSLQVLSVLLQHQMQPGASAETVQPGQPHHMIARGCQHIDIEQKIAPDRYYGDCIARDC
jgi:hypothetical protein